MLDGEKSCIKISNDSLFAKYFTPNLPTILDLGDNALINDDLTFKYEFMESMVKESIMLKSIYEPMIDAKKKDFA